MLTLATAISTVYAGDSVPGATLADDLKTLKVELKPDYANQRPRLLYGIADRDGLKKKAEAEPELWKSVVASAKRANTPPAGPVIAEGKTYWRIEVVQSAALVAFVNGDTTARDNAIAWMVAHAREPIWGTGYRPNLDLVASWYLYHVSMGYDTLHPDIPEADRKIIRDGLASHAKAIFDEMDPAKSENIRYDQNHTYIPAVAMISAALALQGEVPEAEEWLRRGVAIMNRCRFALGHDGYYYEGVGYWSYALHWHVRYADLMSRATGVNLARLPALADTWLYGLHLSLPGSPGNFDIGDSGQWAGDKRPPGRVTNHAMLWGLAGMLNSAESRAVADMYQARNPERDYPAAAFLWSAPQVKPRPIAEITPYHYFNDHDVVTWRSGWDEGATAIYFRCGPPQGHDSAKKLKQMTDWTMNSGHVHPDIGAFYLYAKGANLAVTTGYTAAKWTKDHNTLLIDGLGQGADGTYWNDRGVPYAQFDGAKIEQVHLSPDYAYAAGTFGSVYTRQVPDVKMDRRILATKRYLLIIDDMASPKSHTLTWLCHADATFKPNGSNFIATLPNAQLAIIPLTTPECDAKPEETIVQAGIAPGPGKPTQRGHKLSFTLKAPAEKARLVNLLVPLDLNQAPPTIEQKQVEGDDLSLTIKWQDGKQESVKLNLAWKKTDDGKGPATVGAP